MAGLLAALANVFQIMFVSIGDHAPTTASVRFPVSSIVRTTSKGAGTTIYFGNNGFAVAKNGGKTAMRDPLAALHSRPPKQRTTWKFDQSSSPFVWLELCSLLLLLPPSIWCYVRVAASQDPMRAKIL